jgi:hypothetical protein
MSNLSGTRHLATAPLERGEDLRIRLVPGGDAGLLEIRIFGRRAGPTTRGLRIPPQALPALIASLQAAMAAMPR